MENNKKVNIKVGITIIVTLAILLYGIAFLKEIKFGVDTNEYTVYFPEVSGLKEGDPVGVMGVAKGKVKKIELVGDSVKVDFNLSKDVVLKKDYSVSVAMIELMSGKQIYVKPGRSNQPADISKPLVGDKASDIVSLINTMTTIGDQVKELTAKLSGTTEGLNKTIDNVNSIVGDEGLKSNIRGTASNFNTASRNLNLMLDESRKSLNSLASKLNSVAGNIDETFTETKPELKGTISDIRTLTSKLDTLTVNLNTLVLSTKDSSNTVGKLLTQDDFYNNLNKTILSINKLVKHINKEGIRLRLF
jgi:phospholipid/cholesterol/gamma-HCH transport system substrate-binding protein